MSVNPTYEEEDSVSLDEEEDTSVSLDVSVIRCQSTQPNEDSVSLALLTA
jgi:hypothetical protein